MRVLILDENADVRSGLARLLRRHGLDVSTSKEGQRALRRLREGEVFECVIFDLLLPDMTGRRFVESLSEEDLIPLERVVVLTTFHNVENATAYLQYGCAGYYGKPYDNSRILDQVLRICGLAPPGRHLEAIL